MEGSFASTWALPGGHRALPCPTGTPLAMGRALPEPGTPRGKAFGETCSHTAALPSKSQAAWRGSRRSSLPLLERASSPMPPRAVAGTGQAVQSLQPPRTDFPASFPLLVMDKPAWAGTASPGRCRLLAPAPRGLTRLHEALKPQSYLVPVVFPSVKRHEKQWEGSSAARLGHC